VITVNVDISTNRDQMCNMVVVIAFVQLMMQNHTAFLSAGGVA